MSVGLARGGENTKTSIKPSRPTPPPGCDLACALPLIITYIVIKKSRSVVDWEEKIRLSCSYWQSQNQGAVTRVNPAPVVGTGMRLCPSRDAAYRASLTWDTPLRGCERRKGLALCPKVSANPCKSILFISQGFCREDPRSVCTELPSSGQGRWQEETPTAGLFPITPALTY